MPEIFRFTQLRNPSGINVEEERLKHIPFFKFIEPVQEMSINQAFQLGFESGLNAIEAYVKTNIGFHDRSEIPIAVLANSWNSPLNGAHKAFFELSNLSAQVKADRKESDYESLFAKMLSILKSMNQGFVKEIDGFSVYFEDLLVLYFRSNLYPSYLRLLIRLRRWHYVFTVFPLEVIQEIFQSPLNPESKPEEKSVYHYLFEAKILLPKDLFKKNTVSCGLKTRKSEEILLKKEDQKKL